MPLKLAIVGRPNVGKSTLFNRLAGRRLAIVNDQPGVTRDRRVAPGRLGDIDLELIDTAGFEDVTDESLEARMRAQTEQAIEDADLCLFVFDSREGITPLDRIFADLLRRRDKPVIVVANKAEGRAGELGANDAFSVGLGAPIPLSAEHGEGMSDLYDAVLAAYPGAGEDDEVEDPADKPVMIAIVGRPNAGKSTLVNRLIGEDRLLTGPEAGITRDAISVDWTWEGRPVRLVDTAGLRRKARVQETLEKLSTHDSIRAITFAEVVILVMDANNAFETQDLQLADLVEREGRGLIFCIAKWDLVENPQERLAELKETADRALPQVRGTPMVALSAETGRGVERLMPAVFNMHKNWSTKVKTRDLNDWLAIAVQRHPPPAVNGRRIKPKYMAQLKGRPPTFVLFASRAEHLPDSYRRYLINGLRESFDLPGVPIRITIKANKNPYADAGDGARFTPTDPDGPSKSSKKKALQRKKPTVEEAAAPAPAPKPKLKAKPGKIAKPPRAKSFRVNAKPGAPKKADQKAAQGKRRPAVRTPTTHKLRKPKETAKKGPPKGR
ncbi:MAG TPA: ribosome biogenesis GTPase Der [Caulobacteraceae bacterium]|jgi:GTP-binding protein|nr:ribosome biogenesis GTPase Der [Caulobacteraceae bacterium]